MHSQTSGSSSSKLSTIAIQEIVDKLRLERCRDMTRRTYYRVWKLFNAFFIRLDQKPDNWESRMVLFTGFLIDNQLQSSTIRTYLSAVRSVLAEHDIIINENLFLINSLTRVCKLKNDHIVTRLPIGKGLLQLLLTEAEKHFLSSSKDQQPYLCILYCALLASGYYGLLRVGELTKGPHTILARNVQIGENKKKILFILETSKTDGKESKPQMVKITQRPIKQEIAKPLTKLTTCNPFDLLQQYLAVRPLSCNDSEQFFVFHDNTAVTPCQF